MSTTRVVGSSSFVLALMIVGILTIPGCGNGQDGGIVTGPVKHKLTVSVVGNGRVEATPTSSNGYYPDGASVVLQARPGNDFKFGAWAGGLQSTNPRLELLMTSDLSLTANFLHLRYDLRPAYLLTGSDTRRCASIAFGAASIQIVNDGPDVVRPPVRVVFSLVDIGTGVETTIKAWDDYTKGADWAAGSTLICGMHTSSVGCGLPPGYYMYQVTVDPANRIHETSEANNRLGTHFFYLSP